MKNTVQVHRNGGTAPKSAQAQTKAPRAASPACLRLFAEDGRLICGVDIAPEHLKAFSQTAAQNGLQLDGLLKAVTFWVVGGMQFPKADARPKFDLGEFEAAKAQSNALPWLLTDAMRNLEGSYGEETDWGITELIIQTQTRMENVFKAAESMLRENKQAAQ